MHVGNLLGGSHLLNALGINSHSVVSQLQVNVNVSGGLQTLSDNFGLAAGHLGANMLAGLLQSGGIPGAMMVPPPMVGHCMCPQHYAMPRNFDFGASGAHPFSFKGIMARRRGARFERALQRNPFMRQQAEMMLGGRIIPDGRNDGRITVQPFAPGFFPAGGSNNFAANQAMGALNQISSATNNMAGGLLQGLNGFNGMIMGALGNLLGKMMGGGGIPGMPGGMPGMPPGGLPFPPGGMQQPLQNGPHQKQFGLGKGGDISSVLGDPSLSIEDKVVLMLMMIAKKMDKDIEKQMKYVNSLQQQQNKNGGQNASTSIDIEGMKLKRLIDKRSQMFDILRQIIDKYNQTAKSMIDSIGR